MINQGPYSPFHHDGVRVLHSTVAWLKLTESWIYWLVKSLPRTITFGVVCERIMNAEEFHVPGIRALQDEPVLQRMFDKIMRRIGARDYLRFQVRVAKEFSANVLHSHFGHVGWSNIGVARDACVKHVVSFYGTDVSRLPVVKPEWRSRYKLLFSTADLIICEGEKLSEQLQTLGCPLEKIKIHHLGVPVSDIVFTPRSFDPGGILKVLAAATFLEKKGIPDAIHALGKLKRTGVEIALTIAGDSTQEGRSIREKQRILSALNDAGLSRHVQMLGYLPHHVLIREAYNNHIFLSPSRTASDGDNEGGAPVTIIEMSATGLPIVSTRHCDIPSIVHNGETGLLADEGDIDGLCGHLAALARNPEEITRMGKEGRRLSEREFDSTRLGLQLSEIYRGIL